MQRTAGVTFSGLVAIFFIFLLATPVSAAWNEAYCSNQNTGNTDVYTQQFMSNGNCTNHCRDLSNNYAFAVIKYYDCYCSNLIPSSDVDISRCQKKCPGFGDENCGSVDDGLYIYIQNGQPSGTAQGPSSAKPTPQPVSSSAPPPPPPPASMQASSSSWLVTSSKPPATSQAPPPTSSQISLVINTENGDAVTRTVYLTPSSNPSSTSIPLTSEKKDSGSNTGAIVGGVVGGLVGLGAIVGGLIFFLWRRRKQQRQAQDGDNGGNSGGITRNTSTMSKAGLLGTTREINQYPPHLATNVSTQNSRYGDHESISPSSNRRNSQPLVIDSRLNPNAVMTFAGASMSRESVASLDDSRDYGRQLNVRNPDP